MAVCQEAGAADQSLAFQFQRIIRFVGQPQRRVWWLTALLWLIVVPPARADLEMRVAIEQDVAQVKVGGSTETVLRDSSGQVLAKIPAMNAVVAEAKGSQVGINQLEASQIWIEPVSE